MRRLLPVLFIILFCGGMVPFDANMLMLAMIRDIVGLPTAPPAADARIDRPWPQESYVWRPVAVGGGGFVTGIAQDAKGQTRVIRTDVHGAYRWDGKADHWVQMASAAGFPPEFRVQAGVNEGAYEVAVAPSDPYRVYMAIKGRVLRSDDGGRNWHGPAAETPAFVMEPNSEFRFNGPFMAVDPHDRDHILLGTPRQGLWRSVDGGLHWAVIASVPLSTDQRPAPDIQAPGIQVWFAPPGMADGGLAIWAASAGHGLFVARGKDARFVPMAGSPMRVTQGAFDRQGSFYATDYDGKSLWRYRKGGWIDLARSGAMAPAGFRSIAIRPDGRAIVAMTDGGNGWCSTDGEQWHAVDRSIAAGANDVPWMRVANQNYAPISQLQFDAARPGRLWIAQGQGVFVADTDVPCGRLDWRSMARGIEEIVTTDIVAAPGVAPVFAGYDFGIHVKNDLNAYSTTYGPRERVIIAAPQVDWTPALRGFLVTNASDTRTECCSEDGDSVLAGYSLDGGRNWSKFASLPHPPGTRADDPWRMSFGSIAVASDDSRNIVWAPAYNRSPYYTLDRGQTWSRIVLPGEVLPNTGSYGLIWTQRKTLAADRVLAGTFYLVHSGEGANIALTGLWKTEDGGRHWRQVYIGEIAPKSQFSAKLRAVPGRAGNLFFTSGLMGTGDTALRRSIDGGVTWTVVPGTAQIDDVAFGRAAAGQTYPAIYLSGRIAGDYGIWRSTDNARQWQRLSGFPLGRLDQVTVIEADKDVFGRVYVGYKGSGWVYGESARCAAGSARHDHDCAAVGPVLTAR